MLGTWDVIIVGGGPAGSTVASVLLTYQPSLKVLVLERATFPRDHVGESQLPPIGAILDEIGAWDKVEAAGFPIKIGASYTWGQDAARWDFDFYPIELWRDEQRPAAYDGQRRFTALQVDRAIYDEILLDHAAGLGADVRQGMGAKRIIVDGDEVKEIELDNGEIVKATHFVDASGVSAQFRRAFGIQADVPKQLRNIAVWDYWQNADWAVEIGVGGTRVQVRSLPWGWIWFIPLGPTRTSIGLICPHDYHKKTGKTPAELYEEAIKTQPDIASLLVNATPEGKLQACKDWSHLADRIVGENWFICGEAAGFADPILAAGMTLAHTAARDVAYTILEMERQTIEHEWLRERYNTRNRENIRSHIRFAEYWYAANGQFTDLQEHCSAIAKESGLDLDPQRAWQWLAQGGFTHETTGVATVGSFDVASAQQVIGRFDQQQRTPKMQIDGKNIFRLSLDGAKEDHIGLLKDGRITKLPCLKRDDVQLALTGHFGTMFQLLRQTADGATILNALKQKIASSVPIDAQTHTFSGLIQALEVMVQQGWVEAAWDPTKAQLNVDNQKSRFLRSGVEGDIALAARAGV